MRNYIQWKTQKITYYWKTNGFIGTFTIIKRVVLTKLILHINCVSRPLQLKKRESNFREILNQFSHTKSQFRVTLLVSTFLDIDGIKFFQGGAERYIVELNKLIKEMGGNLEVYQCGASNWQKNIHGVDVFGMHTGGINLGELNRVFHQWVEPGDITIYFQMLLSSPRCNHPSICISHGIDWDAHWLQSNAIQYKKIIKQVIRSIANVSKVISVDTNTINWIRATNSKLSEKCIYIPNFVDTREFTDKPKQNEKFIILYPRRLSEARGFWLVQKNISLLIQKYPQIQIHFCGKAEPFEENEVIRLCGEFPLNVKWYDMAPDRMADVYQSSDIVVIPTCYSEGTSLSLLEAMACKKPVIATNVGGLSDLILPGFNGIQIEPVSEDLLAAIYLLIENPNIRDYLAINAFNSVQVFDKSIWENKWQMIIASIIPHKIKK
ncbi:MAG: glycosyltransferase family 4 protein [Anaerolineales bacterium]|nr:glycosyltransferase family 4 protein [Anaerolineales bacterium]